MATIGRITAIIAPLQYDQSLVFCNNLPYAIPIEYGHSRENTAGHGQTEFSKLECSCGQNSESSEE